MHPNLILLGSPQIELSAWGDREGRRRQVGGGDLPIGEAQGTAEAIQELLGSRDHICHPGYRLVVIDVVARLTNSFELGLEIAERHYPGLAKVTWPEEAPVLDYQFADMGKVAEFRECVAVGGSCENVPAEFLALNRVDYLANAMRGVLGDGDAADVRDGAGIVATSQGCEDWRPPASLGISASSSTATVERNAVSNVWKIGKSWACSATLR